MPLPIAYSEDLTIPDSAFNSDGLAVLTATGGRYGGNWNINVLQGEDKLGMFDTSVSERAKQELLTDPGYPDRAAETAFIWLMGQARKQGLRVVQFECLNSKYDKDSRPYFCTAQVIVANKTFTPVPGVVYADQMTLDAVMAYTS